MCVHTHFLRKQTFTENRAFGNYFQGEDVPKHPFWWFHPNRQKQIFRDKNGCWRCLADKSEEIQWRAVMLPGLIHNNSAADQCDPSTSCLQWRTHIQWTWTVMWYVFSGHCIDILPETALKTLFGPKYLHMCELGFTWFVYYFLPPLSLILKWRSFLPV